MKKLILPFFAGILLSGLAAFSMASAGNSGSRPLPPYACEENLIEVMFIQDSKVRLRNGDLTDLSTHALEGLGHVLQGLTWHNWQRITDVPESTLDQWETNGERNSGQDLYNLNNIYRLEIPTGYDVWELAASLEALPGIYMARPVPRPMPAPLPPNYQSQQGYLGAATNNPSGVDATWAWTQTGGTGTGVTVCDLEYSWNYNHADITKAVGSQINTNLISDPFNDNNHGTAVIGALVADNNGWGITGICYGAGLKTCATNYNSAWNVPGALTIAIAALSAGDIIIIEQQWDYTGNGGYVPIEWWLNYSPSAQTNNAVYAAIVTAIANGIHVVEAGGNGAINTGTMTWYGNSGAIIVGAGGASVLLNNNLKKLSFSSYGPRFDLQGWGENVVTTGYGDLYSSEGVNYYYTNTFNGTSSSSPVVAGALACAEGYYLANVSATPPTPAYMRSHLSTWGTAQVTPPTGNIGPRPNTKAAIQNFPVLTLDFGDAPDAPYPTLITSNGARHTVGMLRMGTLIDPEQNGQPNLTATGDDINPPGADDEDGVVFTSTLIPGTMATVQVTVTNTCFLNAWIDFNKINIWADPGEQIFTNTMLTPGVNNLSFMVPAGTMPGFTYARFRVNMQGGLTFVGPASDGEVEDYQVFIDESYLYDWGDAPDSPYPTKSVNNGANHRIDYVTYLGLLIDDEPDGQPDPAAMGDDLDILYPPVTDDEDGVVFPLPLIPGQPGTVSVTASVQGFLNAWFDWNKNGSWADPGEQVFVDLVIPAGTSNLMFPVPPNASGQVFCRFRFSTIQGLTFTGMAPNGEVEDYMVYIEPQSDQFDWGDAPDFPYPTRNINGGANHFMDGITFMGLQVDGEPDGQPDPMAMGDDLDILYPPPNDDEDGVTFPNPLIAGQPATVNVVASVQGFLNAWFDWNNNGSWADPGEQVFTNVILMPGLNGLLITIPNVSGQVYARFRFCTQPGIGFMGPASNGEVEDYLVNIEPQTFDIDWGDAPDPFYPTLGSSTGANHYMDGVTFMGLLVDAEPDGQPDPMAMGDDLNPSTSDDEDGVTFLMPWVAGGTGSLNVNLSAFGYLNAWFDFNNNGSWADAGEWVIPDMAVPPGLLAVSVPIPVSASGPVFARFRFCNYPGLSFTGPAQNGEVEDYMINIEPKPDELDWGDAPDTTYPTYAASNGARHLMDGITYLGLLVDSEPDGQPDPMALGDDLNPVTSDDEDGVIFQWPVARGNPCKLKVTASVGSGLFNGWIDFNRDGDWRDAGEHVFTDLNLLAGDNYLTFITPWAAKSGLSFARFRFSHQPALADTGYATDGEVEDYGFETFQYGDLKWYQPYDTLYPGVHVNETIVAADDWICNGGVVTDLHWWGNYEMSGSMEKRGLGINHFVVQIFSDNSCLPGTLIKSYTIPFSPALEIYTGYRNNENSRIFKYDFMLPEPFIQVKDSTYWISVQAYSNDPTQPAYWRWQEANRWYYPVHCPAAINYGSGWAPLAWPSAIGVKYTDFAFQVTSWVLDTLYLQNITVTSPQNLCYDANNVIYVAGGGTTFTVNSGASVTMIAGQKIVYQPGTVVQSGAYMHGYITSTGAFCSSLKTAIVAASGGEEEPYTIPPLTLAGSWKVYPNPTTGRLVIDVAGLPEDPLLQAELRDLTGRLCLRETWPWQPKYEISLANLPRGVYLLRLTTGRESRVVKVVKE